MGCRKSPNPCRVPMARVRMMPPQRSTTPGVRQLFIVRVAFQGCRMRGGMIAQARGPYAALSQLLRPADDESLREIHLEQAQLIEHFMALDEFRDSLDAHGVALVVDR